MSTPLPPSPKCPPLHTDCQVDSSWIRNKILCVSVRVVFKRATISEGLQYAVLGVSPCMPSPATRDMTPRSHSDGVFYAANPVPCSHSHPQNMLRCQVYAGAMILVYPVGIPVLFAYLLIMRRDKINPPVAVEAGKPTLGVRAPPLSSSQDHHRALSEITEMDISTTSHIIYEDEVATVGRVGTAVEYTETSKRLGSSSGDGSSRGDSVCSIAGTQRMLDCMHTPTAIAHRKEVKTRGFHMDDEEGRMGGNGGVIGLG